MKKKDQDNYIPIDIWRDAKEFYVSLKDDVEIYKKFKCFPDMKQSEEADKFVVWFSMERFADYPGSLILINEHIGEIIKNVSSYNLLDGYEQLQFKLIQLYRLLKENGMINE